MLINYKRFLKYEKAKLPVRADVCNRYKRKSPKVDASIFDSALSHTRRSDASEKKEKKIACPLLDVFACGQVSTRDSRVLACIG